MPRLSEVGPALLDALRDRYGPAPSPDGGPGEVPDPFESILAAALSLIGDPRTASAARRALRDAGLLQAETLASADPLEIEELFRTSKVRLAAKALRPIRQVARWVADHDFDREGAANWATEALREEWRRLKGVGPTTVNALLLFGLGRPTYPLDRSTYRMLVRHGWIDASTDHEEARGAAEGIAPGDPVALAGLSHGLERLGREYCRPSVARCEPCPLRPMLPPGGPIEAGD